ncbi:GNAT family N-acetyltransferase [Pseudonocardia sp. GCM10023141]|uniref:GNAT family N-acetyltransferase n=1 Tax=Pseudonocardia sp. GCM10023141 TaxID=3252653 RepID=UPI00362087FD
MLSHPLTPTAELRALEPWNATEFAAHVDAHRDYLGVWLNWDEIITDTATAAAYLQSYADRTATDTGRIYGIWLTDDTGPATLVGGALFRTFDVRSGTCEVGVWIAPDAAGRGLVTHAVRFMIDWAVRVRGLSRVEWVCEPGNVRSVAAAKRLGMVSEGIRRSVYERKGTRRDLETFAVLADDWADHRADDRATAGPPVAVSGNAPRTLERP